MEIRLIDANKLFEEVGHIQPQSDQQYDDIGKFMKMITNSPTIKPPYGYEPMEGGWMYFGLPEMIERVVDCQFCDYYNGDREYCACDHYAQEWGYCHSGDRKYNADS